MITPDVAASTNTARSALTCSALRPRWAVWASGALVAAVTFIAFLPVLKNDFVNWDDVANFLANPRYRGLGWANLRWMFTATLVGHYSPLAWLTHAVDYQLWGLNPWGYHLGNLLLHAANAGVFYFVARRLLAAAFDGGSATSALSGSERVTGAILSVGAAFAALVFSVHPLRVESVAWATERQDVLCGLFYLAAALAYLRGVQDGGMIRRSWAALSVGLFLLALLSKPQAMPLPAALLLLDIYPLRRVATLGWRRLLVEKIPYLVLAALMAPVALIAQSHAEALAGFERYGIGSRLVMMAYSFAYYPWRLLWWADLSPLYLLPGRIDPLAPRFFLAMMAVAVVTAVLVALRHRWPAALAAWVYSALLVLPVSGMVHAGIHVVADRYSYLSGLGFALLGGAGLVWVLEARGTLKASVVGACVLAATLMVVGLAADAWRQTKVWHDTERLWRHVVSVDSRNSIAHHYLADWLKGTGRLDEALMEYRTAAALADRPDYRAVSLERVAVVLNLQAIARADRGDLQSARELFGDALRAVPGYPAVCDNLRKLAGMTRVEPQELQSCP